MVFNLIIIALFIVGPLALMTWLIWVWTSGSCLQLLIFAVPHQMIPQICGYQLLYLIMPTLIFILGTGYVIALWNDIDLIRELKVLKKRLFEDK